MRILYFNTSKCVYCLVYFYFIKSFIILYFSEIKEYWNVSTQVNKYCVILVYIIQRLSISKTFRHRREIRLCIFENSGRSIVTKLSY